MRGRAVLSLPLLVVHKVIQRFRFALDERLGYAHAARNAQATMRAVLGPRTLSTWLARPGAGRFWLSNSAARRWARASCTAEDLRWAEAIVAGRYDLLGETGATLGNPPAWHRDLYTGREWPRAPASSIPLARNDGGDIRTIWELSRCYHFVPLAKAWWKTGDPRFCNTFRDHVVSWLDQNPTGFGANWRSPMDAAIRSANWTLAVLLFAEAEPLAASFWIRLLANLRETARFVARHLEWHPVYRGNHYVSNAVGLVYVGALFRDDAEGAAWLRKGTAILRREMTYQVSGDGVNREASLGYHRLVTELFTFAGEICERSLPGALPAAYWDRLRAMYGFIVAYLDGGSRAPLLGDADDGRLHQLSAAAATRPVEHLLGLRARYAPEGPARSRAFPQGGFYVLRSPRGRCVVRCGGLGMHGAGTHDHNDQLSFELSVDGVPLITDSGTYAYTRSLRERYAFRSTAAHNAVQLGGEEQNPIREDRPWRVLADRTRSRCAEWNESAGGTRFSGVHSGFSRRPSRAVCRRLILVEHAPERWLVQDRVEGQGAERLVWRAHFAPGELSVAACAPSAWRLEHSALPGSTLIIEVSARLELALKHSRLSERYGQWVSRPMLELGGSVELPIQISLKLFPAQAPFDPGHL